MVNYLMMAVALMLSAIAAYYSIMGLAAIFAAAFIPIIVMGSVLEVAKLVAASWVYRNWYTAPLLIRYYLSVAIVILMFITSMGTFGYLSKAHTDQAVPTGEAVAKLEIVDEKINSVKYNIELARKGLKQMDSVVDQTVERSDSEKSIDKARYILRTQQKERNRLLADIESNQKILSSLNEERAPIAAQVRKVESEVGPIKFLAALFTDSTSQTTLENAVRWVIILLVLVFDPLAVIMLLAANHGLKNKDDEWTIKAQQLMDKRESTKIQIDPNSILKI